MGKKGKGRGRPRKKKASSEEDTQNSDSDYHHHLASAGDDSGSTCHEPVANLHEYNISETRKYGTRSSKSLLVQCTSSASPGLRGRIRNVNSIASPNFNLGVPPEPQVRMSEASFSQAESSNTTNLPPTSADITEICKLSTNCIDTAQASNPIIPPPNATYGAAPELSLPLRDANKASAINENQTEGTRLNVNQQSRHLARTSSFNCTEIVAMFEDSGDDEVDSAVDPSLVTVQGYQVKEEVAPLLGSILLKYGDIAKDCFLRTIKHRSMLLLMVCNIYLKLEKRNPTEKEIKGILEEVASLEAEKMELEWLRKKLEEFLEALEERKMYKARKEELERNKAREERLGKVLEESRKNTRQREIEADEARKRAEESRKKTRLLESEVAAIQAEVKESDEAVMKSCQKIKFLTRPLVDGLLEM